MINLDKFLSGEVAYVIDRDSEDVFLSELESKCNIKWLSGDRPTKYKDYWTLYNEGEDIVLGIVRKMGVVGLSHGYRDDFKNYEVEVFQC